MKKSIRNLVIGAAMTIGVFAASTAAMAATQFVQNDMNFRSGAGTTATCIGSVPAGAQVEVLESVNGWDRISYNGMIGFIHGGNVAASYTAPTPVQTSTKVYFDNNWKSPETIARNKRHLNGMGVNYLLNVGPDGLGRIPSFSLDILRRAREIEEEENG